MTPFDRGLVLVLCFTASVATLACGGTQPRPNSAVHAQREADAAQLNSQRFGTTPFSSRDQLRHSVCVEVPLEKPSRGELTAGCGPEAVARE